MIVFVLNKITPEGVETMGVFNSSYRALIYLRDNNFITKDEFNRNCNNHFQKSRLFHFQKDSKEFDLLEFDMDID